MQGKCECLPDFISQGYENYIQWLKSADAFDPTEDQEALLWTALEEMECGNTDGWSDLDGVSTLTWEQVQKLWARRTALILYTERHGLVGYSCFGPTYSLKNRERLFKLYTSLPGEAIDPVAGMPACAATPPADYDIFDPTRIDSGIVKCLSDDEFTYNHGIAFGNPLFAHNLMLEIVNDYGWPQSPGEAIESIIQKLIDDDWKHVPPGVPPIDDPVDYWQQKYYTCHNMPGLLFELARAFNMPALVGLAHNSSGLKLLYHTCIYFPVPQLIAQGDLFNWPGSSMPAIHTLIAKDWFDAHSASDCVLFQTWRQANFMSWFDYWDESPWGDDLKSLLTDLGKPDPMPFELVQVLLKPEASCGCEIGNACECNNRGFGFDPDVGALIKWGLEELGLEPSIWDGILEDVCSYPGFSCLSYNYADDETYQAILTCAVFEAQKLCCPDNAPGCNPWQCDELAFEICKQKWCDGEGLL